MVRSRWRVVVASIAAALVVVVGVPSTAHAVTAPNDPGKYADFFQDMIDNPWQGGDYEPKDMKVSAPSSVIGATGSESPTRRVQEVNQWRSNPQAWIDAKNRNAQSSGLSGADFEREAAKTGRWQPKLGAMRALGAAGILSGAAAEVAWIIRDGVLYPALGMPASATEDSWCVRHGNWATDMVSGMFAGADCAPWRLSKDYDQLVGGMSLLQVGTLAGLSFVGTGQWSSGDTAHCYSSPSGMTQVIIPEGQRLYRIQWDGTDSVVSSWSRSSGGTFRNLCGFDGGFVHQQSRGFEFRTFPEGEVVESMRLVDSPDAAEWITRVRCADGSIRTAVSDSFQQKALGGVAVPSEVALDGCQVIGVDLGMQKQGSGTTGASDPWSTGTGGTRTGVGTLDVPTEVQDWMRDFPSCWDGSCVLELKKVIGDIELDCFIAPGECVDWFTEVTTAPNTYRCYYGGQLVAIEECNVYSRVFERTNVQTGTGYADPKTGETVTTSTGTGTGTGTTVKTNPGAATIAMELPALNPNTSRECWPTGWGVLNPFEWVFKPVKCVFEWAFVPRPQVLTNTMNGLRLAGMSSKPGELMGSLSAWTAAVPSSGTCTGPHVGFALPFGASYSGYPISACAAPASTMAGISRAFLTFVFISFGLFALTRYAGTIFGFVGFGRNSGVTVDR